MDIGGSKFFDMRVLHQARLPEGLGPGILRARCLACRGGVTQEVHFAPNQLVERGAKLLTSAEDVIEELPTPIRAALLQTEAVQSAQRNRPAADGLSPTEQKIYQMLSAEESRHMDDLVENTGLNSSDVLATLFNLERKGIIRRLPGKQGSKVLLG